MLGPDLSQGSRLVRHNKETATPMYMYEGLCMGIE